jgi:PAS domain S-box-containing protein
MSRFNPLLWPKPPVIWRYGIVLLAVAAALIISQSPTFHLQTAPVSLFLCAVIFSAWLGGAGPGLLAAALSALAFYYYFLHPIHSFAAKPEDIPRFVIFTVSALFVGSLAAAQRSATESLRGARDDLIGTVQQLQRTNEALQAESGERKRAEEELRRSEAYLAEAQRLSRTGSFGWGVLSGEIAWSDETFRIFEFDRTVKPTVDVILEEVHPDDRARVRETIDRASNEKTNFDLEHRLLMPDGTVKYLRVVAHAQQNRSGDLEFVGAVTDITDRKRAEEALRRSEGYLAEAQRLTRSGSWAWNVRTGDIFWSREIFRIYDYDPEKMKPTWPHFLERVHPEDRPGVEQRAKMEATRKEKVDSEGEFRIVLPEGKIKHLHSIARSVMDESGEITEIVGTIMDITSNKQAEEALRQAHADLAHVNRVTAMGELTASLAHEVNQPIAAAVTNANTCLRWLVGDAPNLEEARAAALRVVTDGRRAAEIISRVRLLFKKGTPERELLDVNEVVREMIVLLRGEAARHNISVRMELAGDLPQVMGDRVQLQQVMMNLIMNSIDAMQNVGGTRELAINSRLTENDEILVSVSDTGVGLPPHQADQIFNAFFTTKLHGTGMGLRISGTIVESHGGRLWAGGNSPRGASFHFTLPTKVEAEE